MFFAIPLRSKFASKNWEVNVKLFNRTLKSVYNQIDPNFKILIAHHDEPDLFYKYDERVEFIRIDYPVPRNFDQQRLDKYYKKRFLMKRIRELGSGYVMFVDADDLVSNKIASFVNMDKNEFGYYVRTGYEYYENTNKVKIAPRFHNMCGTNAIIKYSVDDLPTHVEFEGYDMTNKFRNNHYFFDYGMNEWVALAKAKDKPLSPLPFKGAIYVLNSGENLSKRSPNEGRNRILLRKVIPGFRASRKLVTEFFFVQINLRYMTLSAKCMHKEYGNVLCDNALTGTR